jgi:hypothetical protein
MADKYHSDTQDKVDSVSYIPGSQDTADLEAGTHTIVPTSRPAIGSAQYSKSLTLPKPDDTLLAVMRIAARLSVNIAGLGTATDVYCSVRVDVDDADHELFNEHWTSIGAKLAVAQAHSGALSTIFDLLKDGAAHTFYFLFWANAASQATIDVVQLWEVVGGAGTSQVIALKLLHKGLALVTVEHNKIGTGSSECNITNEGVTTQLRLWRPNPGHDQMLLLMNKADFYMNGTVATDLYYIIAIGAALRNGDS